MSSVDRAIMHAVAGTRLQVLLDSFHRLTGESLGQDEAALWSHPCAIVAHDTSEPPQFFYANEMALDLFGYTARQFVGTPSSHSAQPAHREERAAMLARLEQDDLVTGYSGIRISREGMRFRISDAVIWNLRDADGKRCGQAAAIREWAALH